MEASLIYTAVGEMFDAGRYGAHSGPSDGMFPLWFFAGPLLLALGGSTIGMIVVLPIAIFGSAKFRKEMSVDRLTTFGILVLTVAAWILLNFFCNYFDMSLLVSVFATSASLIVLAIILAIIIGSIVSLLQALGFVEK